MERSSSVVIMARPTVPPMPCCIMLMSPAPMRTLSRGNSIMGRNGHVYTAIDHHEGCSFAEIALACRSWSAFNLHDLCSDGLLDMGLAQTKQAHTVRRISMHTGLKAATYPVHA